MVARVLRLLHILGAIGLIGALAACMAIMTRSTPASWAEFVVQRRDLDAVTSLILMPSLGLVLVSGLLSMAATPAYMGARWAWIKALSGLGMFEGTLVSVVGSARRAAELAAAGPLEPDSALALQEALRVEHGGQRLVLLLALANVVLAVWRPSLTRRPANATP